jgi:hypothetical protein
MIPTRRGNRHLLDCQKASGRCTCGGWQEFIATPRLLKSEPFKKGSRLPNLFIVDDTISGEEIAMPSHSLSFESAGLSGI